MSENKNPFEDYCPNLFPHIRKAGHFISHFILGPHLFSPVSDHEFKHPLDPPLESVTDDWVARSCPDIKGREL